MTYDDELELRLERWLVADARPLPESVADRVMARVVTTPQGNPLLRRLLGGPRSFVVVAAAALTIAIVAVGPGALDTGWHIPGLDGGNGAPVLGGPDVEPSPEPASPTPTETAPPASFTPPPSAPPGAPFGAHDGSSGAVSATNCVATGWAVDPDDPSRRVRIRVLVDGWIRGTGIADRQRADLAAEGISDGHSAFRIDLRAHITVGATHLVRVEARDAEEETWHVLADSPKTLRCAG